MKQITSLLAALMVLISTAAAQEPAPVASVRITEPSETESGAVEPDEQELPNRCLLLCCGLPGDEEHRERLTGALEKIIASSETVLGVSPERLQVLAGDEEMRDALADQASSVGICTKETVASAMQGLCSNLGADDACWVMLLGHANLYDVNSKFNVLDSDFNQTEFAAWAKPLACREQVFWITMPVSGFWVKPLSGKSRVVISATEADLEFTGTEMPYALADLLTGDGEAQALEDVDQDGAFSLLDLYLAANLEIHGRFTSIDRLQTEHAQLEDNGDGRGSEIQLAYLPEEVDEEDDEEDEEEEADEDAEKEEDQGADEESSEEADESSDTVMPKKELPKPISNVNLDGFRSRHILLKAPPRTDSGEDR